MGDARIAARGEVEEAATVDPRARRDQRLTGRIVEACAIEAGDPTLAVLADDHVSAKRGRHDFHGPPIVRVADARGRDLGWSEGEANRSPSVRIETLDRHSFNAPWVATQVVGVVDPSRLVDLDVARQNDVRRNAVVRAIAGGVRTASGRA